MPLPPNWEIHESKSHPGAFYYFNTYISLLYTITGRVTGQSTWEEPIDEVSGFFYFSFIIAFKSSLLSYSQETQVSFD